MTFPLSVVPTPKDGVNGTETILIEIAPDKVGQVIGSKGAIIQEIQMRTGAKAFVNQDFPEGVNRQVNITGTPVQVKAAAELVKLIIDQGPTAIHINSLSGGPTITTVLECTQAQARSTESTAINTIYSQSLKHG